MISYILSARVTAPNSGTFIKCSIILSEISLQFGHFQ
jgi:hypothetical protein